jgi:hypothetical protein
MKKIILSLSVLFSIGVSAQESLGIYTESTEMDETVAHVRFNNGQGFAGTEPETAPYEGAKNYLFTFNGTSSYFHAILFPRNEANTSDIALDLSAYSYYNLAIKTSSASPFYIRMRGNGITSKVLIDPATNAYGFENDNEWHFLNIPFADFIPEADTFSIAAVTEAFVLRSNSSGSVAGLPNDFEVDNIFVSTGIMNAGQFNKKAVSLYPNPASGTVTINASDDIDSIAIHNLLGQKVLETAPAGNSATVDISSLQGGMYVVSTQSQGKTAVTRLIVK